MKGANGGPSWRSGKGSSTERGYGSAWRRARLRFLYENPLCVFCLARGRGSRATVVDHKVPHRGDQQLFWDEKNWQALCSPCHNRDKKLIEAGKAPRREVGLDGYPIEEQQETDAAGGPWTT